MKKAFNFRSAIVCVLVLIMCLMAFVACDKDKDGGQTDNGLVKARDYVKQLYINDNKETAADYTVVSKVNIGGVVYSVSWTVEIKTEGASVDDVKVVPGTDSFTIDVIDMAESSIDYTLTATVTDANGNTETVSFERTVPKFKVSTWAEYAEAPDGKLLIVDGVVTIVNSKTNGSTYNSMYIQDEDGAYYAYSMKEDPADKNIAVGMTVRLTGTKKNYNGTYELENVLIKEVLSTEIKTIEPTDITEVFKGAESTKANVLTNMQGRFVTIKNAIAVEVDSNQKYCYFTVDGLKTYIRPSASAGFLDDAQIKTFMSDFTKNLGHVVEVTGQALVYNGAFYMQPTTADAVKYGDVADLNPAAQVKFVKDNANALANVTYSGYSVELPSASDIFSDVKIAWSVDNKDVCTIADGKATFTYDYATEGRKVKLTATYTHATDTTVAPLTNEYELELLIPQDVTVKEFLEKDEDSKVYIITGYVVADGSSSGTGSFVVADATGAVFSYNKADVTLGEKVKVYGTRTSNSGVDQIGTLNVVKVDDGTTYTYPEAKVVDGTTLDLSTLSKTSIGEWTGVYTEITGLTFYKNGSYNSAGLLNEGATAGSTNKGDYTQVLSLYSASDAIPEEWAGKPVNVYGYVRGFSTNKYLTIQVAKVEIGYSDAQKVAEIKAGLELATTTTATDFDLPTTDVEGATITWNSDHDEIITIDGNVAKVTAPAAETDVKLTATITVGEASDTVEFTVKITVTIPEYNVTLGEVDNGTLTATVDDVDFTGGELQQNKQVVITITVNEGYEIVAVRANGTEITKGEDGKYTVTVNDTDISVTVQTRQIKYATVTVGAVENGTLDVKVDDVDVEADKQYRDGTVLTITATAEAGYKLVAIKVNGEAITGNTYTIKETDTALEITAEFAALPTSKVDGAEIKTIEELEALIPTAGNSTKERYYTMGYIKSIENTTYGNATLEDFNGKTFIIYGMYDFAGSVRYDSLKDKPVAGDFVVLYGTLKNYTGKKEMENARIAQLNDTVYAPTFKQRVEEAMKDLELATEYGKDFELPATGLNGTTIEWISGNTGLVSIAAEAVDGKYVATVTVPASDENVTLTAKVKLGTYEDTKEFSITVKAASKVTLTFAASENGTFEVKAGEAVVESGAELDAFTAVTVTVTPADGYRLASYTLGEGEAVTSVKGKTTFTFDVTETTTLTVTFEVKTPEVKTITIDFSAGGYDDIVTTADASNAKDVVIDGVTYTYLNSQQNSGYLFMKSSAGYFANKTAINGTIKKIEVITTAGGSGSAVYYAEILTEAKLESQTTGKSQKGNGTLTVESTTGGSFFNVTQASNRNGQIAKIIITYEEA